MTTMMEIMTHRPKPLTNLADEDRVILFPSLGHLLRSGKHWVVDIHGDVSAPGEVSLGKRVLLRLLRRTMHASQEAFASPLFQERIARFLAHNCPGRQVTVQIGDRLHNLEGESRRNGHFQGDVRVPIGDVDDLQGRSCLPVSVCGADESPVATGQTFLLARTGLSVISDIDDTLKHSHVACRRTLLTNTFLRPFMSIPGMSPLFQSWAAAGAAFHYVSSSPWQLYEHLAEHLAIEGFPAGSFHLRAFRLRDHLVRRLLLLRRSGKASIVRSLLKTFPHRQFLLVGDSGERDPEIYGTMARRFPHQIAGIFIRHLAGPKNDKGRYDSAFQGVDPSLVRVFRHAWELEDEPTLAALRS